LEISDPGQVVYREARTSAVVEHEVTLQCGTTLPDVYIWSFTKPGTDTIRAVVYNFGKGPKLQELAHDLGDLDIITNSSSLFTKKLLVAAEGLYTCQALYDAAEGARLYYYYVYLRVLVPVSKPYILLSNTSAVEGSSFWMRCGLENGSEPINYMWEQESRSGLVTPLADSNNSLVNIIWVTRNHTGWYRCLARNEVNQQRSDRIWLDVLYGPDLPQVDVTAYSVTDRGYSALERGNVSLTCQASSNPPSQYAWLYNSIEIYTGAQLTITNILRLQAGYYTCLAQNTYINSRSRKTITLTVYYPPDGAPNCSIFQASNYTDLALFCSWVGGYPPATLKWSPYANGNQMGMTNFTQIQTGPDTANNSLFTCYGSHVALNITQTCSVRTWLPYGEPQCSANSSQNKEYLMLSCSWMGGYPQALVWWASSSGDVQGTFQENSNILVLRSSVICSDKTFVCHAKHPLTKEIKTCLLKLEPPVLITESSVVTVFEGNDIQLTCSLSKTYPPATEILWYNKLRQNVADTPKKYIIQRAGAWSNLTVRETDSLVDNGYYWCSATNAVGRTDMPVLLLVMKYPMPPNVTISKIIFSSRQRTDVNMEWTVRTDSILTGFFIERQRLPDPDAKSDIPPLWQKVASDLEPSTRSYQINNLDPTVTYAFRITAMNRRTTGNPSEIKSPVSMPVSKPYIVMSDPSPVEGTSVWMSCGLEMGTEPVNYIWEQESRGGLVSTLAESSSSRINITWVTCNQTGWYRCLARNEVSQQRSERVWLDVIFGPEQPEIDVTAYSVTDQGYTALEKRNISLTCQASSNPPSQYVWFYNNTEVYTGTQLTITKVLRGHSGHYACLAQNTYLNTRSKKTVTLTVYSFWCTVPATPLQRCSRGVCVVVAYMAAASGAARWLDHPGAFWGVPGCSSARMAPPRSPSAGCRWYSPVPYTKRVKLLVCIMQDPPDGVPTCSILPVNNYTDLALSCSWMGGYPAATLKWSPYANGDRGAEGITNVTLIQPGPDTANNSVFTCHGSHVALTVAQNCSTRTWLPYGEPQCSAYVTRNNEYLMLSCSWEGGFPRALLWWASDSGDVQGTSEETSNIMILRSSANYSGKAFACHAKHPLSKESKPCVLKLEAPVLMTQRSVVSVYEGNDVELTCILSKNFPAVTEVTWYNNLKQNVDDTPKKYVLQRSAAWSNLTVRETDSTVDSGQYWCSATNAVGGAEIPVLLLVKRYPMPPNVTITKITYSSHQRTAVTVEWLIQAERDLTGFFIELQKLPGRVGKSDVAPLWQKVAADLELSARSYQINSLDPTGKYAFRVTAVNRRTIGHPSQIKSPALPGFNAYSSVIGAAIGGMIVATVVTVLIFIYVLRNRNNIPRELFHLMHNSQSRENINFPEDQVAGGAEDGGRAEMSPGTKVMHECSSHHSNRD
ncbi:hypothetical protein NFI96_020138, partial [Prochilodus magdalenae]